MSVGGDHLNDWRQGVEGLDGAGADHQVNLGVAGVAKAAQSIGYLVRRP